MNSSRRTILAAGLKPSTVGPLRSALQPWGQLEVSPKLRHAIERVKQHRPALVILPADRGAGLAACDRLRTDDSLGHPLVWLLSEEGLTARLAAHWLRPTRAHLYGMLPVSPEFIEREVGPLLPESGVDSAPPSAPVSQLYSEPSVRAPETDDDPPSEEVSSQVSASAARLRERLDATRNDLRAAEKGQAETNAKLAQMREALATAHTDLAKRHDDLRRATEGAQRDRHRVDELEDALDTASRKLEALERSSASEIQRLEAAAEAARREAQTIRQQLEGTTGDLAARLDEAQQHRKDIEASRSELEARLDDLRKRESTLRQSLQATRTTTEAESRRKDAEVEQLQSERTGLEGRVAELEHSLTTARQDLANEQEAHRSAVERFEHTAAQRDKDLQALKNELASVGEETQGTLKALSAARHTRAAAHAELEDAKARWGTERQRLIEARDQFKKQLESTELGSADEQAKYLALSDATDRLRRERDALEARQDTLHATIHRLQKEGEKKDKSLAELTRERDGFRADRDDLVGVRARLRSRLDVAEGEREEFRAEVQALRSQLKEWTGDYEALRRERDALREERNRLAEQHLPVVEERNRLRDELGPLRASRDQANQALEATRARLAQLRAELDAEREKVLELEIQAETRGAADASGPTDDAPSKWRTMFDESRVSNERLRTEVADLAGKVSELTRTLESTRSEGRELSRRLAAAELEAEEARTQQIQDLDWFMETLRAIRGSKTE